MRNNVINITLTLTEQGVKRFNNVPAFMRLLHQNQRWGLKVGPNYLTVNHTAYGSLLRMVGCDKYNMSITKTP